MLTEKRYEDILKLVDQQRTVTVTNLSERLGASESTIRRDLLALDRMGKLVRVHGGATSIDCQYTTKDLKLDERYGMSMTEKRAIASYAAALIKPDDFVYVDAGSTTEALCDSITETYATYVTNSIAIASKLVSKGCRTIVLGGELKDLTRAMVGPDALEVLAKYHFTKGFWGTNGASPEYGFTTPDINEADIKRRSMERCDTCYVLCDVSKFNQISPVAFAAFDDATVITGHLHDARLKGHENIIETMEGRDVRTSQHAI